MNAMENFDYELCLAGDLLQYPERIQDLEIHLAWFEKSSVKEIVKAIQETNGNEKAIGDIERRIKSNNPLSMLSVDDLLMLKEPATNLTENLSQYFTDQVHKTYIQKRLVQLTDTYAKNPKDKYLDHIAELKDELEELNSVRDDGNVMKGLNDFISRMEGHSTNFIKTFPGEFDTLLGGGLTGGSLYVIGARPAVGKTSMALNLADNIVSNNKKVHVDFFSLEMPLDQMMNRYVAKKTRINSYFLRNPKHYQDKLSREKREEAIMAYKEIAKLPLKFYTAQSFRSLNKIIRKIKKNAVIGNYVPIIDHALLIDAGLAKSDRRLNMIEVTKRLKSLSNELNIPIVLLTQLNRETDRTAKKPTLADLQESASFEQDANVVMLMYLEDPEDKTKILLNIAKNRDGFTGVLPFKLIGQFADFSFDYNRSIRKGR